MLWLTLHTLHFLWDPFSFSSFHSSALTSFFRLFLGFFVFADFPSSSCLLVSPLGCTTAATEQSGRRMRLEEEETRKCSSIDSFLLTFHHFPTGTTLVSKFSRVSQAFFSPDTRMEKAKVTGKDSPLQRSHSVETIIELASEV